MMRGAGAIRRLIAGLRGDPGPPPLWRLDPAARRALASGRAALAAGDRAGAVRAFARATAADGRAPLLDWGLLPHLEAEGRGSFRDRMRARVAAWWGPGAAVPAPLPARLAAKPALRAWAAGAGFAMTPLLATAPGLDALDWAALPAGGLVIKPANSDSRQGVIILADGIDHMAQAPVGPDLAAYAAARWAAQGVAGQGVLVEALIADSAPRPGRIVPRDLKGFAVAGRVVFAQLLDRNGPGGMAGMAVFDRSGRPLPRISRKWPYRPDRTPPPGFAAAIAAMERLSALMPWLARLDFYATPDGPLLGEITAFPSAGLDLTPFARRTLLQMWEIHPD
jgi:hypothetical protein